MDNTLIYSDRCHIGAYNKSFVENGLRKLKGSKIKKALTGETHFQVIKKLYPKMISKIVWKIREDHNKFIRNEFYKYSKKINGVVEVLKKLRENYDLCLVSNCTKREINALLNGAGIDKKFFKSLVGSDEVKYGKPHPDELIKTERLLHKNINYMVGDSIHDIKVGKKMAVVTIGVLTGNTSKSRMLKEKPDFILKSIKDMPKLMEKIN